MNVMFHNEPNVSGVVTVCSALAVVGLSVAGVVYYRLVKCRSGISQLIGYDNNRHFRPKLLVAAE